MKKTCLVIIAFFTVLCLSGCNSTEKVKLNLNCNGNITEKEYKVGDKFNCKLLNNDYEFKIVKISNNLITFKSNKTGLTAKNDLLEQAKTFTLKKGEELKLRTQTMDHSESLIIK